MDSDEEALQQARLASMRGSPVRQAEIPRLMRQVARAVKRSKKTKGCGCGCDGDKKFKLAYKKLKKMR